MSEKLVIEVVLTKLSEAESKKAFENVEKKAGDAGKNAGKNFGKGFNSQLKNIASAAIGVVALSRAFRALSDNISAGIREVRSFSRSIAEVNSILPDNEKLTRNSINTFKDFAGTFATDTAKQAQAFYNIVSAGVKGTATQLRTLEIANKAAVAGLVDIDTAAKALVSSVNAYSKTGLTATQASDALFIAVREGQTTFGELSANIGTVAPVAASAGLKFEELAGAISGVTKAGIRTDIAITGIRALLASLIKVTPAAADEAKRLGLDFSTAALRSKGFVKFLEDLREKTRGSEVALGKLFPNVRALGPILQVVNGNFEDFSRIQGEVQNAVGATDKAAQILQKSLDFQLEQASAAFKILRQEITSFFTPALTRVALELTTFFTTIRTSASETSKLQARINLLTNRLEDLKKNDPSDFFINSKNIMVTYGDQVAITEGKIRELTKSLIGLQDQARIQESPFERLFAAQRKLRDIDNELKRLEESEAESVFGSVISDNLNKLREEAVANIKKIQDEIDNLGAKADDLGAPLETSNEKFKGLADGLGDYWKNISIGIEDFSDKSEESMKKMKAQARALTNVFKQSLAKGISGGIQNIITSIGKGEDAFKNFSKFFLQTIGDMAIKMGEVLIFSGIGIESLKGLQGGQAIAAGAALVAIGTIIKNAAGGGDSEAAGSAGGGGNIPIEDGGLANIDDEDFERQTSSQINITVEGSLVQQEELGQFIAEVQSEINQKNGAVIVNPRFA